MSNSGNLSTGIQHTLRRIFSGPCMIASVHEPADALHGWRKLFAVIHLWSWLSRVGEPLIKFSSQSQHPFRGQSPIDFVGFSGTAEAVPFQNLFMIWRLGHVTKRINYGVSFLTVFAIGNVTSQAIARRPEKQVDAHSKRVCLARQTTPNCADGRHPIPLLVLSLRVEVTCLLLEGYEN